MTAVLAWFKNKIFIRLIVLLFLLLFIFLNYSHKVEYFAAADRSCKCMCTPMGSTPNHTENPVSTTDKYSTLLQTPIVVASPELRYVEHTHPWDGVPAKVEEDTNITIFKYRNIIQSNITGLPLKLSDFYKKRFGWPPTNYVILKNDSNLLSDYVFVTAATDDHFREMLDMLSSVQIKSPTTKVVVFDLGWKDPAQIAKVKHLCNVEYRWFDYSAYPEHVKEPMYYAFKPLVVAEALKDYPRVLWIDASIRFSHTGDLSHIRPQLLGTGGVLGLIRAEHSIYSTTDALLYNYLPPNMEKIRTTEMGGSGFVVFFNTEKVFKNIVLFWVLCALEKTCAQPSTQLRCVTEKWMKGEFADCHRFDQSVLSLLMGNMLDYNYKLYRDYMAKSDEGDFVTVYRAAGAKYPQLKVCS